VSGYFELRVTGECRPARYPRGSARRGEGCWRSREKELAVDLCNLLNKIVTIDTVYKDKGRK